MSAVAADPDELIKQGNALRRKGDDAAALEKFQQAYDADPRSRPRAIAQVGLAEQALGRWVRAYEHLIQALASKDDPWIAKNLATLEEALKTSGDHVGQLEILGGTPGAEVRINGALIGRLPLSKPLALPIGTATIALAARGYVSLERATSIRAGQIARESFDALAAAETRAQIAEGSGTSVPKAVPPTGEPSPVGSGESAAAGRSSGADDAGGSRPSPLRLSAKWVAGGLAVIGFAGGTIAYLAHNDASDEFRQKCYEDPTGGVHSNDASMNASHCLDLQKTWNSTYRWTIAGVAAGAAFAITGIALWLTEPATPATNNSRVARFACAPGLTGAGGPMFGCAHRF